MKIHPMKSALSKLYCLSSMALFLSSTSGLSATLFYEDFENGLDKWTGKTNGPHSGIVVQDPLSSGRNNVITFTNLTGAGDLFTINRFSSENEVEIQFDYLGLEKPGSVPGNLGGFIGTSSNLFDENEIWLAGTSEAYPVLNQLIDDGQWHQVTVKIDGPLLGTFHLKLEDWVDARGVPGDIYFDNILIKVMVEPLLSIRVSEIEICWNTQPDQNYILEYKTSLMDGQWLPYNTNFIVGDGNPFCVKDIVSIMDSNKVYRLLVQ